jgi:glutamate--cysteine ligase catalytic subunit
VCFQVEYVVVVFDDDNKRVRLCLRAPEILSILQEAENEAKARGTEEQLPSIWRPEYGSFMIEGTPGWPYGGRVEDLLVVQDNMAQRRKEVQRLLQGGEVILCLTHFPLMGVDDFTVRIINKSLKNQFQTNLSPLASCASCLWPCRSVFVCS